MNRPTKRIAINLGGGYVPGLNAVIHGAVLAAGELGWEIVGIRDGYEGLLFPERYADGGLVKLTAAFMETLAGAADGVLGTASRTDPFHVRTVNAANAVEESDRSDELLQLVKKQEIDAVISVVDAPALGILWKLHRKGLKTVCVPKSAENQIAATLLSFGFNSALSFAVEVLDRTRQAAQSARKIGVVEVPGEHAGWLALQAGMAVCADAVLIPEIPYNLAKVAAKLSAKLKGGRAGGLIVVAEGATPADGDQAAPPAAHPLKASLSPGATGEPGSHVIQRSGHAAETVALKLQRLVNHETYPLVLGQLVKGGPPTAVDRQLGLGYGAAAVRAIREHQTGTLVAFQPPDLKFIPLAEAINRIRTVPADSVFVQIARALGIALGD
ncbi:MAG TPA: 6-phosphofructokinase [Candidatus Acidoferrum sp.]|nr:6-phosphofructokinase [Candidatus Acidoferrum sp.]